jgi:phospholipase/carboxylesterase
MPLEYEVEVPEGGTDGAPLIVLLHGRGSDRRDLLGLRAGLPAEAVVVTPQAPFPGEPWGYGGGWAWYRYLAEDRPEPQSFDEAQRLLEKFLKALPAELTPRPGPLVLGGFSQGGTMALAHALRRPGEIPHLINFSGFLADHPSFRVTRDNVRGTRIFWGHGTEDPAIPHALARRGRRALRAVGAELEERDYEIGHWIDPEELADASAWLRAGLGAGESAGGTGSR